MTKTELLKTTHAKCMDCCCYQAKEVKLCPADNCPIWPFRLGHDPYKTPRQLSEKQRENLAKGREKRNAKTL